MTRKKKGEISSILPKIEPTKFEIVVGKMNSIRQAVWREQRDTGKSFSIEIMEEKDVIAKVTRVK